MLNNIIGFSNSHPVVATTFAVVLLGLGIVAYKLVALVVDAALAIVGRPRTVVSLRTSTIRTPRAPKVKVAPPVEEEDDEDEEKLAAVRAALAELGYAKREYEPVLAEADLSQDVPHIIKQALRTFHAQAS